MGSSAKGQFFKQCRMVKPGPVGRLFHVAWIPEEFARVGKVLALRIGDRHVDNEGTCFEQENPHGAWSDGWVVEEVWTRLAEEYVRDNEQNFKSQRKASDKFTPNKGLGIKR